MTIETAYLVLMINALTGTRGHLVQSALESFILKVSLLCLFLIPPFLSQFNSILDRYDASGLITIKYT